MLLPALAAQSSKQKTSAECRDLVFGCLPPKTPGPGPRASTGGRVALVLGNNDYKNAPVLQNATNDAQDLGAELGKLGFGVSKALNADLASARGAIDAFTSRLQPGDTGLLFYAGHGIQSRGENYIVPVDFDPRGGESQLDSKCIRATGVKEAMEKAGANLNIVVLDACRNNPFRRGEAVKGMALMEPALGTSVSLATGPGQTASDNSNQRNGLYTKHLLEEIAQSGQNLDTMFKKVKDKVFLSSGGKQRPWTFSDIVEEFYFVPVSASAAPPGQAPGFLEAGKRLYQQGRFEEAVDSFEKAMRLEPENPFIYNALGSAHVRLKHWSVALDLYGKAIARKPDYAAAYFNRGVAYYNAARYELALQDFSWAVEQEPYDPMILDLRGKTHLAMREQDLALVDFSKALELDPSDSVAMTGLGNTFYRQGRYDDALRLLTDSLAIRPSAAAFEARSRAHRALHHSAQADEDARQADSLLPAR